MKESPLMREKNVAIARHCEQNHWIKKKKKILQQLKVREFESKFSVIELVKKKKKVLLYENLI